MSANRLFRADAAAFCAKRGDNLSRAVKRQALVRLKKITGRILTLPPIATLPERDCVVLDQPQRVGKHWGLPKIQCRTVITLLRLVFDTAARRGSVKMRQKSSLPKSGRNRYTCS